MCKNLPYIEVEIRTIERRYNPDYGDDRMCECGHVYHRHFDGYEDNAAVGCKYCGCYTFVETGPYSPIDHTYFNEQRSLPL